MLMPDRPDLSLFAPCGIDCLACYVHLKAGKACPGCLADGPGKPPRCHDCAIKACAASNGLTHCHRCSAFPCRRIKNLEKSYVSRYGISLLDNSASVATAGLAAFMAAERNRWACACGGTVSQHDGSCSECGKPHAPARIRPTEGTP